ncbi:MAG: cyclase family protein [Pyrinomonadaceae bacterium]
MIAKITLDSIEHRFDPAAPIDISIPLRFGGMQPNAYGVEIARTRACEYGDLVGDTRRGGSCNFEQITLTPHCNGTHTECVGHVTDERISVRDCLQDVMVTAVLVTVGAEQINGDSIISRGLIADALTPQAAFADALVRVPQALIVRTLPNDDGKLAASYGEGNIPAYFSTEAMEYMVECGFKHLLVDLPSIDRIFDEGELANHRIFWGIESGSREINSETRLNSTITELIYVPNEIEDGEYLLNLQIAPFETDASPSRPVLFKLFSN